MLEKLPAKLSIINWIEYFRQQHEAERQVAHSVAAEFQLLLVLFYFISGLLLA